MPGLMAGSHVDRFAIAAKARSVGLANRSTGVVENCHAVSLA